MDRHLERITKLSAQTAELITAREAEIAKALTAGATWAQIGAAVGITTQGAHKRYRHIRHDPVTGVTWHEPPLPES